MQKVEFGRKAKALFGKVQRIIQRSKIESLEKLKEIDFDGYALGGLAVGENQNEMLM